MYTNKEINTLKGLLYAASCAKSSYDPTVYRPDFDSALERYFSCYPNDDETNENYSSGDLPVLN